MNTPFSHFQVVFYFTVLLWLFHGYSFGGGNHGAELPPVFAIIDPALYVEDFVIKDFLNLGPRYFYYSLVAYVSMGTRLDVDVVYICLKILTHISLFAALLKISDVLTAALSREGQINATLSNSLTLLVFAVCSVELHSWGSSIFFTSVIPSTLAMSIAIWSLAFAMEERWVKAFVFCGIAILFQPLVGFFAGVVLLPALFLGALTQHRYRQLIGCVSLLFIPMIGIYVMTITAEVATPPDSFEFYRVFGAFRVPHHWFPSTGHVTQWVSDLLFLCAGALALRALFLEADRKVVFLATLFSGMIFAALCGLIANYLFVEVIPFELIGKLQFQRIMPFGHLAIGLAVVLCVFLKLSKHERLGATEGIVLAMSLPILVFEYVQHLIDSKLDHVALFILFIGGAVAYYIGTHLVRWLLVAVTSALLVFVNSNLVYDVPAGGILSAKYRAIYDQSSRGNPIYMWLYENTEPSALVLIPPDWSHPSNLLAFHARRSVYFSFKNVPYSDYGVFEWANRAEHLLGKSVTAEDVTIGGLRGLWEARSSAEVLSIMDQIGACYLVDRTAARDGIELESVISASFVDGGDPWSVWRKADCV